MIGTRVAFSNSGEMLKNGFLSSQHLKHLYLLGECHISKISKIVSEKMAHICVCQRCKFSQNSQLTTKLNNTKNSINDRMKKIVRDRD